MSAVAALPFPHTAFLAVAAVAAVAVGLPLRGLGRARWPAAIAAGLAAAAVAAGLGWVPWLGRLHVAVYGLLMLIGFIAAYLAVAPRLRLIGVPERWVIDLVIIAIVAGLIGARARYVYERPQLFLHGVDGRPVPWPTALAHMADFDSGGMVWYGGALLATAGCVAYAGWRRLPILACADIIMPGLLLGLGVGRVGCFLNGCCYGRPTSLPWGVRNAAFPGLRVHPTQLYETIACGLLATVLFLCWRRRRFDGQLTLAGVLGYALWRFIDESLRGDTLATRWWGLVPMSTSQATSVDLALAAGVGALLVWQRRRHDPLAAAAARRVPGSRHAAPAPAVEPVQRVDSGHGFLESSTRRAFPHFPHRRESEQSWTSSRPSPRSICARSPWANSRSATPSTCTRASRRATRSASRCSTAP